MSAPVIAVDGPAAAGKSTISARLALALGFHLLVSGALYRIVGSAVQQCNVAPDDEDALAALVAGLDVRFVPSPGGVRVICNDRDVSDEISSEACAAAASDAGTVPAVRRALFDLQQRFRTAPGLVAEGRDMGSIVFPDAQIKVFLTASVHTRALRRLQQLNRLGKSAKLGDLAEEIMRRDEQDTERTIAPLKQMPDAVLVDTTGLTVEATIDALVDTARKRNIFSNDLHGARP